MIQSVQKHTVIHSTHLTLCLSPSHTHNDTQTAAHALSHTHTLKKLLQSTSIISVTTHTNVTLASILTSCSQSFVQSDHIHWFRLEPIQ